ncbi:MAG: hypothetical protein JWO33_2169 [Caulobacteraceae bacterium]|nr:hypothetical protein [Caulobacteraceae bacterium]
MKKTLIAAASAAVLALMAVSAQAQVVGHVDGAYSTSNDSDADSWSLGGGVVLPAGPLNLELDATGATTKVDGFGSEKSFNAAAHLFHRNDQYALGAFVAAADEGLYAWGGEGAVYLDRVTLSAQVGQASDESEGGVGVIGTAFGVGGKFFATDNLAFGAGYNTINPKGPGGSLNVWDVSGEYKFDTAPISAFVGYQRLEDFDVDAWTIGARWHFGAQTLKEQDRKGASLGGSSILSLF